MRSHRTPEVLVILVIILYEGGKDRRRRSHRTPEVLAILVIILYEGAKTGGGGGATEHQKSWLY